MHLLEGKFLDSEVSHLPRMRSSTFKIEEKIQLITRNTTGVIDEPEFTQAAKRRGPLPSKAGDKGIEVIKSNKATKRVGLDESIIH